jgi:hypothetical protein
MRFLAPLAGLAALGAVPAFAGAGALAAHRAVYDLSLDASANAGDIASISGRLVMEFTGSSCAGYNSKLRFVTQTEDPDGGEQVTDSRSSTFEGPAGLTFANETYTDETLAEESKGTASRKDKGIDVALTKPADKHFGLGANVVFPTEQIEKIIAAAKNGERFLYLDVYDGSEDGETVFQTAAVIGPESSSADDIANEPAIKAAGMAGMRHWPLTLSYFDKSNGGDEEPFYVMSFVIYENGIGRKLRIDYGDFALMGKLTELDILPATSCPKAARN